MLRILVILSTLQIASALPIANFVDGEDPANIHAVLFSTVPPPDKAQWDVNYVPEAEVARTYHWLTEHGVPADNIVLFMNGNFSNYEQNPFPGTLYADVNKSRNYAEGLKIDYSGAEVTPDNYLAVLQGEADKVNGGTGRVLKSTDKNRVFVSHESHGIVGSLDISDKGYVTVQTLNEALKKMNKKKMFKELVYYIMACKSGSMFENMLDRNGNIYALTAANPVVNTVTKDKLEGEKDGTAYKFYINSEFGKAWMKIAEECDSQTETLKQQYSFVEQKIRSFPQQYGNYNISREPIGNYQGLNKKSSNCPNSKFTFGSDQENSLPIAPIASYLRLQQQLKHAANGNNFDDQKELQAKLDKMEVERAQINTKIDSVVSVFFDKKNFAAMSQKLRQSPEAITQVSCHHDVTTAFWNECKEIRKSPFVEDFYVPVVQLCEYKFPTEKIIEQIKIHCY